jgi:hypothetical protein
LEIGTAMFDPPLAIGNPLPIGSKFPERDL